MSHGLRVILLVTVALMGSGCSLIGFAYNRADWIALQYARGYVDLDSQQREVLKAALSRRLQAHRATELPKYLALLSYVEVVLENGLTVEEAREGLARAHALYEEAVRGTVPTIAPTLLSLSPAQLEELSGNLAVKNNTFHEKVLALDAEGRLRRRVKRASKRIERWTGTLNDSQIALIERRTSSMPDLTPDWFDYRQQKQRELLQLLRSHTDQVTLEAFLVDWQTSQFDLDEQTRAPAERWAQKVSEMITELASTLTDKQREQLFDTIAGYRSVLEQLTGDVQSQEGDLGNFDARD